jgi:glutamate--cysteine ligase
MVPHLTTSLTGPLAELEHRILDAMPRIERWFRSQWMGHTPPFYSSVDLRNAGFKLAPVDTNLFPGGFNNLNPDFHPLAVQAMMSAVQRVCPDKQRFLLIPENHTRNLHYLQNIAVLRKIMEHAGLDVRIGSVLPDLAEPLTVELPSGDSVILEPVYVEGFDPCAIILNNDLSAGVPPILRDIQQVVLPPPKSGWAFRRKSKHFAAYSDVAHEFATLIDIDPWLINPYFGYCGKVNFAESTGLECLANNVSFLLPQIKAKYQEYGITQEPFLIVKADAGTYGMGIMTVKSVDDVLTLNRKTRNKMAVIKDGQSVQEVIIQEGVYTFESINDTIAEPVVYMVDRFVVGGFYRVHTARGIDENLNAPGAQFIPLAFETDCHTPDCSGVPGAPPNRFYTYGVIARLAMLAASIEIERMPELAPRQEAAVA